MSARELSISQAGLPASLPYERSRKIAKISSADFALARLSRTERSFRNFAIEASVRRCVFKLIFRDDKENHELDGRIIQRVELDPSGGPSERRHHFIQPIG